MTRRTRRPRMGFIVFLVAAIAFVIYINTVVVPVTPPLLMPSPTPTRSPESFISQGEEFYKAGKLTQAIQSYQDAIYADPANPSNYVAIARLQVFAGQYDKAIENAQNALLKNQNNALAHAVLGWALGFKEKYGEAEVEIKKALSIDPNNALAYAYYAEILMNQGDFTLYDKAAEASKKAVQLDLNAIETHRARGIVLLNTQNLEEAAQEFQAALAINKNIPDLNLYMGITYRALNEYDLAQEALLAAYALNPTDTVALTELSRAFFADGRYPQAAQYAEEAIKVEPANPRLYGNLGIIYYKMGDYAKATEALVLPVRGGASGDGAAIEGLPLDYGKIEEYYWYYGFALARSNRCGEAVPVFQALLTGVPNDETAVYNATEGLALCQQNLENPPELTPTPAGETGGEPTPEPGVTPEPTKEPKATRSNINP